MRLALIFVLTVLPLAGPASASDVLTVKQLSLELAADIAQRAVQQCRKAGYQVSAVVVDRSAAVQVVMRDALASRFTVEIAQKKANAVVLSGVASSTFRKSRADIRAEMDHVDGILMLEGGLPIRAAGALLGAVGVSGAPGGDKDEACATAALAAVQERLEFAE
jgi:uncharacterized protein GlcG (DUF336 family)